MGRKGTCLQIPLISYKLKYSFFKFQLHIYILSEHIVNTSIGLFICACLRLSVCLSCYLLLNLWQNSTKLERSLLLMVRVCESNIIFSLSIPLCVYHASVCPSHYLLNHWAEFNQTCYITSPHGKDVRKQHYFSVPLSVHGFLICPSVCHAAPLKPLGRIQPNLLHHLPSW